MSRLENLPKDLRNIVNDFLMVSKKSVSHLKIKLHKDLEYITGWQNEIDYVHIEDIPFDSLTIHQKKQIRYYMLYKKHRFVFRHNSNIVPSDIKHLKKTN